MKTFLLGVVTAAMFLAMGASMARGESYSPPMLEVRPACSVIPMGTTYISLDDTRNVELPPVEAYGSGGPAPAGYMQVCDESGCRLVPISTDAPLLSTMDTHSMDHSSHAMGRGGGGGSGIPVLRLLFNSERRQERRMSRRSGRREGGFLRIFGGGLFSRVGARSGMS